MVVSLYFGGKNHGCNMYLLRSPVQAAALERQALFKGSRRHQSKENLRGVSCATGQGRAFQRAPLPTDMAVGCKIGSENGTVVNGTKE